jgi:hypothetical protein
MRGIGASILAAGFLIAVSIAITFRYSIVPIGAGRLGAYRPNHWTGEIVWCWQSSGTPPDRVECTAFENDWVPVPTPAPEKK